MAYCLDKYRNKRRKTPLQKLLLAALLLGILAGMGIAGWLYSALFSPNVWVKGNGMDYVNIPTNSEFDDIKILLYSKGLIENRSSFEWLARQKGLDKNVKPGRYKVRNGMSNLQFVRMLSSGLQEPVKLVFNNIRTRSQLAGRISQQIEADSARIDSLLNDPGFLSRYGLSPNTSVSLFIPNTYEFWWNTSAEQFIEKMAQEHDKFWSDERKNKARTLGMSIPQVSTLASIIEQETNKNDEKARMAGVYINRMNLRWPLQADPTLKFALGDFSLRRILSIHKEIDSPYNTYKYPGLPPGPICIPSISSIDAVLNAEKNQYLFFCAREDMSGYHVFTASHEQHMQNAARYQRALNNLKIYK